MSQLMRMRQRIKAIETIKKITSAMRLISRSLHARMNKEKELLIYHQEAISSSFVRLHKEYPQWHSSLFCPVKTTDSQTLFIIVGAQKSLCGTYNSHLLYWLKKNQELFQQTTNRFLVVGKKMRDHLLQYGIKEVQQTQELKLSSIESITHELTQHITNATPHYSKVIFVSNYAQTFFVHRHKETTIIPFTLKKTLDSEEASDYLWQNNPQDILDKIAHFYLQSTIRSLLFEALAGEQAARFISMDNATRNADTFLDALQLQYNKLRQAKITKELTELVGNFKS